MRLRIYDIRDNETAPNDYTTNQVVGTIGDDGIVVTGDDEFVFGWNGNDTFNFNTPSGTSAGSVYDARQWQF